MMPSNYSFTQKADLASLFCWICQVEIQFSTACADWFQKHAQYSGKSPTGQHTSRSCSGQMLIQIMFIYIFAHIYMIYTLYSSCTIMFSSMSFDVKVTLDLWLTLIFIIIDKFSETQLTVSLSHCSTSELLRWKTFSLCSPAELIMAQRPAQTVM